MWFYGSFTNGYSVNSTEVCEEIHDNSDLIVLLKTEHIYLFKRTTVKPKKQDRTVSYYWNIKFTPLFQIASEFSMIGVADFMDQTLGTARPSVSTSLSSIHSNSWNWNAQSSSFCCRAATHCGLRHGGWTISADCLLGGSEGIPDGVVFCFLCICSCKDISSIDARYNPHLEHNCLSIMFWAAEQL